MLKALVLLSAIFMFPELVSAHAFGKLYNLPVPFWLYLYGGAAAIIVSFLIIGYFLGKSKASFNYPTLNLSKYSFFDILTSNEFLLPFQIISLLLLLLTISTGIFGVNSAYANFNMTFFWIIFLLGGAYLTALIGDFYSVTNPRKVLTAWLEKLFKHKFEGIVKYPKKWGYFPALGFYFIFIWIELLGQTTPFKLSFIIIQYSVVSLLGIYIFGKDSWFKYGEFFGVFFNLISKMAPLEVKTGKAGKLYLRPPFVGLLKTGAEHFSELLFILFMLSSTAFDGFRETTPWVRFYWQNFDKVLRPILGENSNLVFQTVGLLISPLLFLVVYLVLLFMSKIITGAKASLYELSLKFAYTLLPVALVYNIAHYYTLLLTQGQEIIRLISDPFGFGWNLLGTAEYQSNLSVIDAGTTWHLQVAFILLGHIAGVYLAHMVALKEFPTHKQAIVSQIPLLLLMVTYTMIGLWILSQPITSGI